MMNRREMGGVLAAAAAVLATAAARVSAAAEVPRRGQQGGIRTLMQEPLAPMPNAEASVITLTLAPGSRSHPHEHIGPVFAYILSGEIENQVEPNAPRTYRAGDYFYEPAMHVHRIFRNLSATRPAEVLVFQVGEKGKRFTLPAA